MPSLSQADKQSRQRVGKLTSALQDTIDKIYKEEKKEMTYAEINSAIIAVMSNNVTEELVEERKKIK